MQSRIRIVAHWISAVLLSWTAASLGGCDGEPVRPSENRALAARPADNGADRHMHGFLADVPFSPCGNGFVDDGEQCDDGWANGNDRECTHACTFNDCDLDEDGACIGGHWPAADVDLYPCTEATDSLEGCALDLGE